MAESECGLVIHSIKKVEKNVEASREIVSGISVPESLQFSSVKHWGVVLCIFDVEEGEEVGQQLLEAGDNGEGKLQAKGPTDYKLKRKAWKKAPGFAESDVPVQEPVPFKEGNIETFVQKFNANAGDYSLLMNNCQEFVRQLLTELKIENIWSLSGIKSNQHDEGGCMELPTRLRKWFHHVVCGHLMSCRLRAVLVVCGLVVQQRACS